MDLQKIFHWFCDKILSHFDIFVDQHICRSKIVDSAVYSVYVSHCIKRTHSLDEQVQVETALAAFISPNCQKYVKQLHMAYSSKMCPKSIFNGCMILKALANVFRGSLSVTHSLTHWVHSLTLKQILEGSLRS